jgi:hypothetical protein
MFPSMPSRLPLVAITSRPLLLSMTKETALYRLLDSNVETRERALDLWEAALQARLKSSFYCTYTPINSNASSPQGLNYSQVRQPLSSLPAGTYPQTEGIYSCEGLGIQTCQAVSCGPPGPYRSQHQPLSLLRICRDGKAPIHTEDLDLLAQRIPHHIVPWKLVFIVPPKMKGKVSLQLFVGNGDWGGKIVQYVAVVDF